MFLGTAKLDCITKNREKFSSLNLINNLSYNHILLNILAIIPSNTICVLYLDCILPCFYKYCPNNLSIQ